jgi:AbiU2
MNTTEELHVELKHLYGQTLNLFVQIEILNGLRHIENHEKYYYIASHWGEFFVGIRNALVTAIIVDFAKIVSDKVTHVISLTRISTKLDSLANEYSLDKKLDFSVRSDLGAWFENNEAVIEKINFIRNNEAAHNNAQNKKLVDNPLWADVQDSIEQLRDLLLKMINSSKPEDLEMTASSYGSDARTQTTKIFNLLIQAHTQQFDQAIAESQD